VKELCGAHVGQTAIIVGMGPSILLLRARDFPPGPIIAINHAIRTVRKHKLPNTIYTMQKDGCTPHGGRNQPRLNMPIRHCVCPSVRTVKPVEPEILLLSAAESSHCFPLYPFRHVFDVEADFALPWNTMSVPVAARIAHWMGCTALCMIGHDAYTRGVFGRVSGYGVVSGSGRGYLRASVQAKAYAESVGMAIEFR
jgi:hypothetical protein